MNHSAPVEPRPSPTTWPVRTLALAGVFSLIFTALFGRILGEAPHHGPVVEWFRQGVWPSPGGRAVGRPDVWLIPALELMGVALLAWRIVVIKSERRTWLLICASAGVVMITHLTYRLLVPYALAHRIAVSTSTLGLFVHAAELLFYCCAFVAVLLMAGMWIGQPTPGVRLDGLIGALGVLTVGTAALVPDAVAQHTGGWAEIATVLVAIGALGPIALLTAVAPLLGRSPGRVWWSLLFGFTLAAAAVAATVLPLAVGADARPVPGWLLWPSALLAIAWTSWQTGPPAERTVVRTARTVVTPTVFALCAVGVLAVDRVMPQPDVVLVLAFLSILMSIVRMAFALRSADRLNAHHLVQRERLREAREEAIVSGRAQSDFMATLSHEIRTPLNAVIGMTDVLLAGRLDIAQREQVGHVRRSGELILELVNDLLDRTAIDANKLTLESQPFELSEVLGDVADLLQVSADAKGIRLRADLDTACPEWVLGDATRLRQVLINLVGNAVKFTDTGEVSVEVCPAARLEKPQAIYFQVTDTGSGIPAGQVDRLFLPYSRLSQAGTTKQAGTGLGLSISQALVRRMGGEITVTSQEGVGSVFGFELVLPPQPIPAPVAAALRGRQITVLDSQRSRAEGLADQLRRWGAEVVVGLLADQVETDETDPARRAGAVTERTDTVVIREDHPDTLHAIGAALQRRRRGHRPSLVILTASPHALPGDQLGPHDLAIKATAAAGRLREGLVHVAPPEQERLQPGPQQRPLQILLAEDDPASRRVCQLMVQQLGHEIDVVADGAAAVEAARARAYDLLLMDSQMPGLDGVEATRAIRVTEPFDDHVPIVALTGAVSPADRARYLAAGMDLTLAKPVSRAALAELLAGIPRRARVESYAAATGAR